MRATLPYLSVVLVIALIYTAWTFYSRSRDAGRAADQAKQEELRRDAQVAKIYGGDQVKILSFYASPSPVEPGGKVLVCYGVTNAASVSIEPRIEDIKPAISRCVETHPRKDTEYKLTAADAAGHKAEQSFVVRVRR